MADEKNKQEYQVKFEGGEAVIATKGSPADMKLLGGTWVKTKASSLEEALDNARKHMDSIERGPERISQTVPGYRGQV